MTMAWPTGIDGLPMPEVPWVAGGYETRAFAIVLTLDAADAKALATLWPRLASGFWLPAADGGLITLEPTSPLDCVPLADAWQRVRFDVVVRPAGVAGQAEWPDVNSRVAAAGSSGREKK